MLHRSTYRNRTTPS